jgi:hypothetical protein
MKLKSNNVGYAIVLAGVFAGIVFAAVLPLTMLFIRNSHSGVSTVYRIPLSATWGVAFLILIVLNVVTLVRVSIVRRSPALNDRSPIPRLLVRIQIAAVQLIVASIGSVLSLTVCLALGTRVYYSDPRCYLDWDDILFRSARLFLLYGTTICVWFVQGPVMILVSKTASSRSGSSDLRLMPNGNMNSSNSMVRDKQNQSQRNSNSPRPPEAEV